MNEIDYIAEIKWAFNEIDNKINDLQLNIIMFGSKHCKKSLSYDLNHLEVYSRALRDKLEHG